jgi:Uma2 family endonuclease
MSTLVRLTLDEYYRMIDAGVFNHHRRMELIRGELREMSPIGNPHRNAVNLLNEWAVDCTVGLRDRLSVQVQNPIRLPEQQSVPEPDISWIARESLKSSAPSADIVFLVIEVADSTLAGDRGEKADLYAEAGIPDYWIVNLVDEQIEVHRDPLGGRYQTRHVCRAGDELRPLLFPECALEVGRVL